MVSTRVGIGLPNRPLEPGELSRLVALGCTDYLLYVYDERPVTLAYWADIAGDLLGRQPTARIHVRLEARGPLDVYHDAVRIRDAWGAFGDLPATYRIRNEPNQESAGATPREWGRYLVALRAALPPDPQGAFALYCPGLSPSLPGWDHWLRETVLAATEAEYDGLDVHAYGSPAEVRNTLRAMRQVWSGPILCTEHNAGAGRAYDQRAYADTLPQIYHVMEETKVEAVCYFIYVWHQPDLYLPTPVDLRGSPIEAAWAQLAASVGVDPAPPEPALPPGGPPMTRLRLAIIPSNQQYNSWPEGAGRDDERAQMGRFAAQLLSVCQTYASIEAQVFAGQAESDLLSNPELGAQLGAAYAWLDGAPPGTLTVGLSLHSDSGAESHVGAYWGHADITRRLALALREVLGRCFYTTRLLGADYEARGYLAWTLAGGRHCPVLLELGSHQNAEDRRRLRESGPRIAEALAGALVEFFGLSTARTAPPTPGPVLVDYQVEELRTYADWALARLAAGQEPRSLSAFVDHLMASKRDPNTPCRYGFPLLPPIR